MLTRPRLHVVKISSRQVAVAISREVDFMAATANYPRQRASEEKQYRFYFVAVKNTPWLEWNSTAEDVVLKVKCVGIKTGRIIEFFARPGNTPPPGNSEYQIDDAATIDIPAKRTRYFNFAFRSLGDDAVYGFSPKSYAHYSDAGNGVRFYDWKVPEYKMEGEEFSLSLSFEHKNSRDRLIVNYLLNPDADD